jgi:hypothetical protein
MNDPSQGPEERASRIVPLGERASTMVLVAAILVAGIVVAAGTQAATTSYRAGETGLPGRAAALYPTEVDARDACGVQRVAFADAKARVVYARTNPSYGAGGAAPPDRGFGCENDLRANGLRFAP